jgi:hypothetical protein
VLGTCRGRSRLEKGERPVKVKSEKKREIDPEANLSFSFNL